MRNNIAIGKDNINDNVIRKIHIKKIQQIEM